MKEFKNFFNYFLGVVINFNVIYVIRVCPYKMKMKMLIIHKKHVNVLKEHSSSKIQKTLNILIIIAQVLLS